MTAVRAQGSGRPGSYRKSRSRIRRRRHGRIAAALIAALALGFETAAAQSQSGTETGAPQTRAELQSQYNQAFQEMLKNPTDLDITFHFAELATDLGNYEAAISALERMLLFNPNLPRVRFELGVLYFRLGSYDIARTYLTQARDAPDTPAEVRDRVNAFLAEIDKRASPSKLNGMLMAGLRYQSDANAGPGPNVEAGGVPATLSSQFVKRADWNAFTTGNLRHTYDLGTQDNALIETNGTYYYSKQEDIGLVDVALVELNTGPRVDVMDGDKVLFNIRPYVLANDVFLNHDQYLYTLGTGLEVLKEVTSNLLVDSYYEFRFKRFKNSANQPTATQLDSVVHALSFDLRYAVLESGFFDLGTSIAKEPARFSFNSNEQANFHLAYNQSIALPFSVPQGPLALIPAIYRIYTTYDQPDPAIDPSVKRHDREWDYVLTAQLGLYKGLAANLQLQRQVVNSTLPNFKYNNTSVLMGLSWSF